MISVSPREHPLLTSLPQLQGLCDSLSEGLVGEVAVTSSDFRVGVPEDSLDFVEGSSSVDQKTRKGMPKVMQIE